jgi:hypothetical protein
MVVSVCKLCGKIKRFSEGFNPGTDSVKSIFPMPFFDEIGRENRASRRTDPGGPSVSPLTRWTALVFALLREKNGRGEAFFPRFLKKSVC